MHCHVQSRVALAGAIWHLESLGKRNKFQHHHEANSLKKRHWFTALPPLHNAQDTAAGQRLSRRQANAYQCAVLQKKVRFTTTAYAVRRGSQVGACSRTIPYCASERASKAETLWYGRELACCLVCQSEGLGSLSHTTDVTVYVKLLLGSDALTRSAGTSSLLIIVLVVQRR